MSQTVGALSGRSEGGKCRLFSFSLGATAMEEEKKQDFKSYMAGAEKFLLHTVNRAIHYVRHAGGVGSCRNVYSFETILINYSGISI